jgi:hypothetical protein
MRYWRYLIKIVVGMFVFTKEVISNIGIMMNVMGGIHNDRY